MENRRCTLCRKHAIYIDDVSEIKRVANDDGTFQVCMFSDAWEICKEIGDPDRPLVNTRYLTKNEDVVGRIRELN